MFLLSLLFLSFDVKPINLQKAITYHTIQADHFYHHGNYPEMLYHLSEKIKYDSKDVNTWSDLGYYYWSMSVDDKKRKLEFEQKALKYLLNGLNLNKESSYMWDEVGRFYILCHKDFSKALPYFQEAVKKKDCQPVSFHILSQCYLKLNNVENSIETLEKCLSKFPNDAKARLDLNKLRGDLSGG